MSRDAYEKCRLGVVNDGADDAITSNTAHRRQQYQHQLGVCATPERASSISLVFRDFSPLPAAPHFRANHSYYVITTSDGTLAGLNRTEGGLCASANMRMKFDVVVGDTNGAGEESGVAADAHSSPRKHVVVENAPILYVIHTSEPASSSAGTAPEMAAIRSVVESNNDDHNEDNDNSIEDDDDDALTPRRNIVAADEGENFFWKFKAFDVKFIWHFPS